MVRDRTAKASLPVVEELNFRSDDAFLCLLINRRARYIRVIDYRAGALPAKRLFIQSVAQREGIEKVIILVEKDEVSSWTRVGFVREGTVPGFYKRSDGYLIGCVIGEKTASIHVDDDDDKFAERTMNAARKIAKDYCEEPAESIALRGISATVAFSARDKVWAKGEGLGCFDPFGKDALRLFLDSTPRKGKPSYLSAEFQECFGHSLIEVLQSPKTGSDVLAVFTGLNSFVEELKRRGIVSAFAFTPYDDLNLAASYLAAGFRKSGLLAQGIMVAGKRKHAILWTRKLADPTGGAEPLEEIEAEDEPPENEEEEEE